MVFEFKKRLKRMTQTIRTCVINLKISYRQLSMSKDLTLSKNKCLSTSFTRSAH